MNYALRCGRQVAPHGVEYLNAWLLAASCCVNKWRLFPEAQLKTLHEDVEVSFHRQIFSLDYSGHADRLIRSVRLAGDLYRDQRRRHRPGHTAASDPGCQCSAGAR